MTARSIRRAAERKARKATARQNQLAPGESRPAEPSPVVAPPTSERQWAANRANAQLSAGPRTAEGKSISSLNAVKTGLTGRTVLLPSDDAEAYRRHILVYEAEYQPESLRESELVQSLADTQWRLERIPGLEIAIYARGREQFAGQFEDLEPAVQLARIELETYLQYQRPLKNLHIQEGRLRRQREKDMAELRDLQTKRRKEEELAAPPKSAANLHTDPNSLESLRRSYGSLLMPDEMGSFLQSPFSHPQSSPFKSTSDEEAA